MPLCLAMIALLLTVADDPAPPAWAAGLASTKSDERHATIDAIEARGLAALPLLRVIAATGPDEVRTLANELIERISTRRLLRPTLVVLKRKDRKLTDAVAALADASGFAIDLENVQAQDAGRKVVIGGTEPIGFFEALDRLAVAGHVRHDPSASYQVPLKLGVRVRLVPGDGTTAPSSYAGPYKVAINALERHREVAQARPPAESTVREDFSVLLDVVAEPGIRIDRNGPIRLSEATDERGRDLRPASSQDLNTNTTYRQGSQDALGTFAYRLPLALPAERGRTIANLRGFVPITAIARTDELFSSPMEGIEGKTISGGGVSLRVTRASMTGSSGVLDATIVGEPTPDLQAFAAGPRQTTLATLHLGFNPDDHLRIEDANGIPFTTSTTGTGPPMPDGSTSYRVTLFAGRATGRPAKLRYFAVAGVATEVPFDFRDLTIP